MRTVDRRSPVAIWKEHDSIEGERVQAFVVILRTRGCWWSRERGCTMCGYNAESLDGIQPEHLRAQLSKALDSYGGEDFVKVYNSGSFLDEEEIPKEVRNEVLRSFGAAKRILFETRPEFVTQEALEEMPLERVSVALGLESASDAVLGGCVGKGFTLDDYTRAARLLGSFKVPLRTYLLLKPPFLTERASIEDASISVAYASKYSESVSINPVNVQAGTVVEDLWRRGDYRPPWLWSLVEVLKTATDDGPRVFSSPTGGGTPRGAHNCGRCDRNLLEAVQRFSFSQDRREFDGFGCRCAEEWRALTEFQDVMSTSVDVERHLRAGMEID